MNTADTARTLAGLFSELAEGTSGTFGPFVLNSGDAGLLRSLGLLSAAEASGSSNDGATIAAHALHLTYGLSLMNRWAREGGDPFADATWDAAWKTSVVDDATWIDIGRRLRDEARRWQDALASPREVTDVELGGMAGSIAHLAYHFGPKEGTFINS